MIHKQSDLDKISQIQFKVLCNKLLLEKHSFSYGYFQLFYNLAEGCYYTRELLAVAILHCYGSDEEKLRLLFENYDSAYSKSLDPSGLKQMIIDLTKISLSYSTNFAISKSNLKLLNEADIKLLVDYRTELICMRPFLISYYHSFILETYPEKINFEEFKSIILKQDINSLLSPHKMRELCLRFKESINNTAKYMQQLMDDPNSTDKSIADKLNMKLITKKP